MLDKGEGRVASLLAWFSTLAVINLQIYIVQIKSRKGPFTFGCNSGLSEHRRDAQRWTS